TTTVMGVVQNTSAQPGFANDADIFVANGGFPSRADWAVSQGISHNNLSTMLQTFPSGLTQQDWYLDYLTRQNGMFFAGAAGNEEMVWGTPRYVGIKGYNTMAVGATDVDGTIVTTDPVSCVPGEPANIVSAWNNGSSSQELP
ncbi:MAG: hypothetical protein GWO44_13805, partial [Thermoplasmata archaeon]|nr:hypothetical protein [Thermoplasmata archaeon]NIY04292.1 hypothetical protein [Thermoplasmata archaeon]